MAAGQVWSFLTLTQLQCQKVRKVRILSATLFMTTINRLRKLLTYSYQSHTHLLFCRGFSSKLFVKGFTFRTTEDDLTKAFSEFGEVTESKIIYDHVQKSKGYGYVTFTSVCDADEALMEMNGKLLDGRSIYVDHVKYNPYINQGIPIARGRPVPQSELTALEIEAPKPKPKAKTRTRKPKNSPSDIKEPELEPKVLE